MVADPLRSRSRRKLRRKLSDADWEKLLNDPAVLDAWGAAAVQDELRKINRRRRNVDRDVPSSAWADAIWHNRVQFPPGADATLMRRCRKCDRYNPPNNLSARDVCTDCQYGSMSRIQLDNMPSSPGCVVDFRGLKGARKRRDA